jgi:hypothetical protein
VSILTLAPLEKASITYTGTTVTVLFRDRDRLSSQLKQMVSHQMKRPIHFIFQTKDTIKHEWWHHGLNFNPFGAAISMTTNTGYIEYHHKPDGQLGCNYGPALIEDQYGLQFTEKWVSDNGYLDRDDDGPAITEIEYELPGPPSPHTHFKKREMSWYRRGIRYRDGSWAQQVDTVGVEKFETIPPMGLMRTLDVECRQLYWYDEKERLHRTDGPAILKLINLKEIEKDGFMAGWRWKDWNSEWWIHGTLIRNTDVIHWAKKNHIRMWNEPCYNRSAFRDEDGEFCFLTDFAGV